MPRSGSMHYKERTGRDNHGLITFKDRWGAARSELTYLQYHKGKARSPGAHAALHAARQIAHLAPNVVNSVLARALYRHLGCTVLPLTDLL
jgi:hypothetical protein